MNRRLRIFAVWMLLLAMVASPLLGLLWLAPALVLPALLLLGRYPGESVLLRCAARRARRRWPRAAAPIVDRRRAPRALGPSGSMLLAFNLATRPPPLPVLG